MCASKNGVSAREIQRKYDLTAKTAWFMTHRIREAMKLEPLAGLLTGVVEADETYIGGSVRNRHGYVREGLARSRGEVELEPFKPTPKTTKTPVFSLVNRETGEVRSQVMPTVNGDNIAAVLNEHVDPTAILMTDQASFYRTPGAAFSSHETVNHSEGEYVRDKAYTNTIEGYFSQLKRSIDGTHAQAQ
jgi:transposase-like protein